MPTYADLKQRIVKETVRDDLLDDLAGLLDTHVYDAVNEYAGMRFWFNQSRQSVATVAGSDGVTIPTTMRIVDRVAGPYYDLSPVFTDDAFDDGAVPWTGSPTTYSYFSGALRLHPTPDAVYALTLYGIEDIQAPVNDSDSNAWTNEAAALISAHTRMTLYRDVFRDEGGATLAANAAQMHLERLRRETERRLRTRPVARLVGPDGRPTTRAYLERL